jgi:hypothetical protein
VGGSRKGWAAHHVRTYGSSDEHCFVQWYKIQPNNYPTGTPSLQTTQRIQNASYYYHDPGIAANSAGDVVVQWNRSGPTGNGGYPRIYRRIISVCSGGTNTDVVKIGPNTAYREHTAWVDFSTVVPDAVTTIDFWGHGMIVYDTDQFQTIVAKYSVECPGGRGGDFDGDGEVTSNDI